MDKSIEQIIIIAIIAISAIGLITGGVLYYRNKKSSSPAEPTKNVDKNENENKDENKNKDEKKDENKNKDEKKDENKK